MASDYSSFVGEIHQVLKRIENLWYIEAGINIADSSIVSMLLTPN
jgi:hypothetical protein